jgi:hypothetical protein
MPLMISMEQSAIFQCRSCDAAMRTNGSSLPWMIAVGAPMRESSGVRSPCATIAHICRATPAGHQARRTDVSTKRRKQGGSGRCPVLPMTLGGAPSGRRLPHGCGVGAQSRYATPSRTAAVGRACQMSSSSASGFSRAADGWWPASERSCRPSTRHRHARFQCRAHHRARRWRRAPCRRSYRVHS